MSGFNIDDRVVVTECGWTLQDGTEPPAYGRVDDVFLDGTCYVEFDMGAQGRLTLPIPVGFLAHDPSIPTLAENVARVREKQRALIAAAGYSLPDGQADTPGIKRDFEPGGLTGDPIW